MSAENHLLAFQLARKAYEVGSERGAYVLVRSYKYFLAGVGCDIQKYGFDLNDGQVAAKNPLVTASERYVNCGWFDPSESFVALDLMKR